MFHARLISLGDGQSYENVEICQDEDLDKWGINKIFENWTACFFHERKCYVVHHWKIKVIHLDREIRRGRGATHTDRLVLDGDILYSPATFIHPDNWASMGIPEFFVKRNGIAGQMAFSCPEGTFITHDTNCTSIIVADPRPTGVTSSEQPTDTAVKIMKQSNRPDTIHGRVTGGSG